MRVSIVMDNMTATGTSKPFTAEHGLSMLIEIGSKKILMDTGQTGNAVGNLALLGYKADDLDAVVLSHGHYDHTGGLAELLRARTQPITITAHTSVFQERFSLKGEDRRYAGIPFVQEALTSLGAQWQLTHKPVELMPNLWFSGQIPRLTEYEKGDTHLVKLDRDGCCSQDVVTDDAVLYYKDGDSLVIIAGCAHSGMENIIRYGCTVTGAARVKGWIGGTHLGPVQKEQKEKTLSYIGTLKLAFLAANHCTGFGVMCELRQMLGERFIPAFVGTTIDLEGIG